MAKLFMSTYRMCRCRYKMVQDVKISWATTTKTYKQTWDLKAQLMKAQRQTRIEHSNTLEKAASSPPSLILKR